LILTSYLTVRHGRIGTLIIIHTGRAASP